MAGSCAAAATHRPGDSRLPGPDPGPRGCPAGGNPGAVRGRGGSPRGPAGRSGTGPGGSAVRAGPERAQRPAHRGVEGPLGARREVPPVRPGRAPGSPRGLPEASLATRLSSGTDGPRGPGFSAGRPRIRWCRADLRRGPARPARPCHRREGPVRARHGGADLPDGGTGAGCGPDSHSGCRPAGHRQGVSHGGGGLVGCHGGRPPRDRSTYR